MNGSIRVGNLFGIPFYISYTWFAIFGVVTISLAFIQYPELYPYWPQRTHILLGSITSLLFFGSVVVHELAHGTVARALGIPVKSITLFLVGGVAHISSEATKPAGELAMAIVGPFSSLMLGAAFGLVWVVSLRIYEPIAAAAGWLASVNVALAIFNMAPGFPMDGGRAFRSILWWLTGNYQMSTTIAIFAGRLLAYLLMLGGLVLIVEDRESMFSGVWIILIGWFLERSARSSQRQLKMRNYLNEYRARDLMTKDYSMVQVDTTLDEIVDKQVTIAMWRRSLVLDGSRLMGIINLNNIRRFARTQWSTVTASQAMIPVEVLVKLSPDDRILDVMERLGEERYGQALVVEENKLLGVLAIENIMDVLATRGGLRV
ncbi:MAG: site-2 protease family protein [Dehalococcoidia bacterium]|nr:site-2 protease family protein [Dehalococcoidia bacterium]